MDRKTKTESVPKDSSDLLSVILNFPSETPPITPSLTHCHSFAASAAGRALLEAARDARFRAKLGELPGYAADAARPSSTTAAS